MFRPDGLEVGDGHQSRARGLAAKILRRREAQYQGEQLRTVTLIQACGRGTSLEPASQARASKSSIFALPYSCACLET